MNITRETIGEADRRNRIYRDDLERRVRVEFTASETQRLINSDWATQVQLLDGLKKALMT